MSSNMVFVLNRLRQAEGWRTPNPLGSPDIEEEIDMRTMLRYMGLMQHESHLRLDASTAGRIYSLVGTRRFRSQNSTTADSSGQASTGGDSTPPPYVPPPYGGGSGDRVIGVD